MKITVYLNEFVFVFSQGGNLFFVLEQYFICRNFEIYKSLFITIN